MLAATIGRSPILLLRTSQLPQSRSLPAGFDDADIAVLDWIAAEGRRLGRAFLPM